MTVLLLPSVFGQLNKYPDIIHLNKCSVLSGRAHYRSQEDAWIMQRERDSLKIKAAEKTPIIMGATVPPAATTEKINRDELKFRHNISLGFITPGRSNDYGSGSFALQFTYQPVYKLLPYLSAGPLLGVQGGYIEEDPGTQMPQLLLGGGADLELGAGKWKPYFSLLGGYDFFNNGTSEYQITSLNGGVFSNVNAGIQLRSKNGIRLRLSGGINYQQLKEKNSDGWIDIKFQRVHHLFRYIVKMGVQI